MSGRSRSLAMTVFFKTELLGMNKVPHRSIVDLEAAPGKFGHKAAQGELPVPDPLHEKDMVLAGNGLGFVAAHLERRHAAWNRRTQLITVLGATPNRAATRCRDSTPSKTAAAARSRRSIDKGLAIHAGLLSSQHVES